MVGLNLQQRQEKVIAQACLTNSKHKNCFPSNFPSHILKSQGAYSHGSDGKAYIDMICGLGSISIGQRVSLIDDQVRQTLINSGNTFSLSSPYEIEAAEFLLSEFLPKYDRVKFLKTGAEATSAAVRMARVATGRMPIYTVGYHGWHDQWISTKTNPKGAPSSEYMQMHEFETIDTLLLAEFKGVAAVIVEPIMLEHSEENTKKLIALKNKCLESGTLLIFDEIVCGTRIPETFISSRLDPDLVCLGKGIANGFELTAVVGRKAVMESDYFVSSTFAGSAMALTGHLHTMKYFKNNPYKYVYEEANRMMDLFKQSIPSADLQGYGTRGYFKGDYALVAQEFCNAGMLLGRSWFFNYSHAAITSSMKSIIEDVSNSFSGATLKGTPPKEAFKRT